LTLAAPASGTGRLANCNHHRVDAMAEVFSGDLNLKIGDLRVFIAHGSSACSATRASRTIGTSAGSGLRSRRTTSTAEEIGPGLLGTIFFPKNGEERPRLIIFIFISPPPRGFFFSFFFFYFFFFYFFLVFSFFFFLFFSFFLPFDFFFPGSGSVAFLNPCPKRLRIRALLMFIVYLLFSWYFTSIKRGWGGALKRTQNEINTCRLAVF
jgi:hypothetical protein